MTTFNITETALAQNTAPRCACVLALDTSSSMSGAPIEELNEGLRMFWDEVRGDEVASLSIEAGVVTFGGSASFIQDIQGISDCDPPRLSAHGTTPMGSALDIAMNEVEDRKRLYKSHGTSYYQPWIVLMTDGQPNDNWRDAAARVREMDAAGKCVFIGVGVGDGVDMDTLTEICPVNRPPKRMSETRFREFFLWLSASVRQVSVSAPGQQIALPPTDSWETISI